MSPLDEETLIALAIVIAVRDKEKKKKKRSKCVKQWLSKRGELSHTNLLNELSLEPEDRFNYMRMNEATYLRLLSLVTPHIERKNTVMRDAITPHERLSVTLRFLATGRSYEDLKFSTAISAPSLSNIIPETCEAICNVLMEEYLKVRET